jgi:hypothetical protein
MTDDALMHAALRRAAGRLASVRFLAVSSGGYAVYSVGSSRDPENAYRVTVSPSGEYRCTCPSELRPACVHRAAVYLVRVQREAGGLEADGPRIGEETGQADDGDFRRRVLRYAGRDTRMVHLREQVRYGYAPTEPERAYAAQFA